MEDYYRILNVSENASFQEIKEAYKQAALFWHPDKNKSKNAHEKFIEIREAYNILGDAEKRELFDKFRIINSSSYYETRPNQEENSEYKQFIEWVKEAKTNAEKIAFTSFDNALTDSFHFLDKYGRLIFFIIMGLFFLIISILMNN